MSNTKSLDDESVISFGKHKGKQLIDVPDNYLIWWYKENAPLLRYIEEAFPEEQLKSTTDG